MTARTVRALKFATLIRYAREGAEGLFDPLSKSSVVALAEEYAPASVYADTMGCNPDVVTKRLRKEGVPEALTGCDHGCGKTVALFRRVEARDALGLAADPEADVGLYPSFWTGFDRYLSDTGSTYRVFRQEGNTARLVSNCVKWRAEIEIADDRIVVTTLFGVKATARTKEAIRLFALAQEADAAACARASQKTAVLGRPDVAPRLSLPAEGEFWRMSVDRISATGEPEVLLTRFRPFLYRLLLIAVERERAYFRAADENGPGGLPHISF